MDPDDQLYGVPRLKQLLSGMPECPLEEIQKCVLESVENFARGAHQADVVDRIRDLAQPDFGDPVPLRPGEIPVFWACGVTPQAVAEKACVELMITHEPGQMFLTDLPREGGRRS